MARDVERGRGARGSDLYVDGARFLTGLLENTLNIFQTLANAPCMVVAVAANSHGPRTRLMVTEPSELPA